jgi:hypothetical protein
MGDPLWLTDPRTYEKCAKCNGSGEKPCPKCAGKGYCVGPKRSLVGRTVHRSFGVKRCVLCGGRRTWGICLACEHGSIRKRSSSGLEHVSTFDWDVERLTSLARGRALLFSDVVPALGVETLTPRPPETTVPGSVSSSATQASSTPSVPRQLPIAVKGSRRGHLVGRVNHYFDRLGVAGIDVFDTIRVGDVVWIWGPTTKFAEKVESIQLKRKPVDRADSNCQIGLMVSRPVCVGDEVYNVRPQVSERALGIHSKSNETLVGEVHHHYGRVSAAGVVLTSPLAVGDVIRFRGRTTDFIQPVSSMELDGVPVTRCDGVSLVGLRVSQRVRAGDVVYRVDGS